MLQPLEDKITQSFLPALTGLPPPNGLVRELMALTARLGGLALANPTTLADDEFHCSTQLAHPLLSLLAQGERSLGNCHNKQRAIKERLKKEKRRRTQESAERVLSTLSEEMQRNVLLAREKGASTWLSARPLQDHGFVLSKSDFRDTISLWYGWPLQHLPDTCVCGQAFTTDHALSCPTGGYPSLRHNDLRDFLVAALSEVAQETAIEPPLQPLSGETFQLRSASTDDEARLGFGARGFLGSRFQVAFFDVRVMNLNAPSYRHLQPNALYRRAEQEKERKYGERIRHVEHASFTPLIFST